MTEPKPTYTAPAKPTANGRCTGTVRWFNRLKGWGFIDVDDGREIFAHYQNIEGTGYRNLDDGDRVEFGVAINPNGKGQMATNITRIR